MKHTACYIPGYPRPQFVRKQWESLNGIWQFAFDDANAGEKEGWFRSFPGEREINVPFCYNAPMSGVNLEEKHFVVWYVRRVRLGVPEGKRLLLHFEGCDYFTKLWVNGGYVGCHRGGYGRFSFDVTPYLGEGAAELAVRVEDDYSCTRPRGKQRWEEANHGCWYSESTGIWKDVWCETVSPRRLERVKITPDIDSYTVRFDYEMAEGAGLEVEAEVSFSGKRVAKARTAVRETTSVSLDVTSEAAPFKVLLWAPGMPNLYDVTFRVFQGGELVDEVSSYFGMRKIGVRGDNLYLNNVPLYLRMVLDQGFWEEGNFTPPSEEALEKDVSRILELGFNGVRKHQKIESEPFYYLCDAAGLIVWAEMPSFYEFADSAVTAFTEEWSAIVRQLYNHPGILVWVPFNESWGIQRVYSDRAQQRFTEAIYHLTKTYDSMRPVVVNDGWEHTVSDIVTIHNYAEDGERLARCYDNLEEAVNNRAVDSGCHRFVFADGYAYRGQPVMISEFAGIAFLRDRDKGWGYGNMVEDEAAFLRRMDGLIEAIRGLHGVCGYCVTQLTDVQNEINGLMYADRSYKADGEKLSDIFRK